MISAAADAAATALAPIGRQPLTDRLTLLGMTMLHGKARDEQAAWLHETARLLQDYPQAILFDAIDECLKEPGRVFAPTVGEIIAKLEGPLREAEVEAAHLREMANLIAEGAAIPDYQPPAPPSRAEPVEPVEVCSPEDARAILEEFGLKSSFADSLVPKKPKTRADYIAEGKVPPRRDSEPVWDGMP